MAVAASSFDVVVAAVVGVVVADESPDKIVGVRHGVYVIFVLYINI